MSIETRLVEINREIAGLAHSNNLGKFRTAVLAGDLFDFLTEKNKDLFAGHLRILGTKGNRCAQYTLALLRHPDMKVIPGNLDFFLVPHTAESYQATYLGKEQEYLEAGKDTCRKDESLGLWEINPIMGIHEQRWASGSQCHYNIPFEELVELLKQDRHADVKRHVLNPPQVWWKGDIEGFRNRERNKFGFIFRFAANCSMFIKTASTNPFEGHLYMQKRDGLYIGVQGRDGYNRRREVSVFGPTEDVDAFVEKALTYFAPEEVYFMLDMWGYTTYTLEQLREAAQPPNWQDRWHDPEKVGLMEKWSNQAMIHVVDTANIGYVLPVPGDADYLFPEDWQGWPKTQADRNFDAAAAAFVKSFEE